MQPAAPAASRTDAESGAAKSGSKPKKPRDLRNLRKNQVRGRNAKNGKRIEAVDYENMYLSWKSHGGVLSANALREVSGFSWDTCHRLIEKGLPSRGWPSFRARLFSEHARKMPPAPPAASRPPDEDLAKPTTADQASVAKVQEVVDEWSRAKRVHLGLIGGSKRALAYVVAGLVEQAQKAKFTRRERQDGKDGKAVWLEVPMSAAEVSKILLTAAQAVDLLTRNESFWLGGPTERHELTAPGWLNLTEDQAKYMAEKGELPPGVTEEMLFGKAAIQNGAKRN